MNKPVVFMFSGQGSCYFKMGLEMFEQHPTFRKWMLDLNEIASDTLGESVLDKLYDKTKSKNDLFDQTLYTHPAIFMAEYALAQVLLEDGIKPDYVLGTSMGEFASVAAAGVMPVDKALEAVVKQAQVLESHCQKGGMTAVVHNTALFNETPLLFNNSELASINFHSHFVVSGKPESLKRIGNFLQEKHIAYQHLPVSIGFHSALIEPAASVYADFLSLQTWQQPKILLISCVYADVINSLGRNYLWEVIRKPIAFQQTVQRLEEKQAYLYLDLGPSGTLANFVKYNLNKHSQSKSFPILTPFGQSLSNLEKVKGLFQTTRHSIKYPPESSKKGVAKKEDKMVKAELPQQEISSSITAESLGSDEFKQEYRLKYAYVSGAMVKGIASKELVVKMAKAGLMSYFGAGGLKLPKIEEAIQFIQRELEEEQAYGMNFLHNPGEPQAEDDTVDLFLKQGVKHIEAAAFMQITPALARYRLKGLRRDVSGKISAVHKVMAKISRPEIAQIFLSPAPERVVKKLLEAGKISEQEAELSKEMPMADDLCVEADSGGHTDMGIMTVLLPTIIRQRDGLMDKYRYAKTVRVGAAGGIGTPEAAAAAFMLGADFILTGSINQCTVEAGTSDTVKDILQQLNVQDTDYAPAGDMFELGAKVQVVRKGLFFPARANKLYDLYRHCNSLDEIDDKTREQIQDKYFHRSFEEVYAETKAYYSQVMPREIEKAERNPKHKMALVLKWYFVHSMRLAMRGSAEQKVDYQIHCGPAMGAFNQWVKGTALENWHNRHVDEIADKLMRETAELLNQRCQEF